MDLAKEPTSQDERVSPPKTRRKPLTIDLPAEEIGRKPVEGGLTSEASPVPDGIAAPPSANAVETPKVNEPPSSPAPDREPAADKVGERSPPADPVIPSAFATRGADREAPPRPAQPEAPPRARPAGEDRPGDDRPRSLAPFLLAAFAGGAIAAIVIIVLALAGYLSPTKDTDGADIAAEIAALKTEIADLRQAADGVAPLSERLATIEGSVGEFAGRASASTADAAALKDLQNRLEKLERAGAAGSSVSLEPRLAVLAAEVAALRSAAPADTATLEATLATLREEVGALSKRIDATPGEERIAAIEAKLDATSQRVEAAAALAPAVAADALAAALDAGWPFANELAALKSLGIDAEAVEGLAPKAESGLPTIADLRSGFDAAMASVELATPIPEETGTIDRLLQSARGLVEVRPAHPTAGSDPAAIVARIRAALAAGDLKNALAEWNTLPDTVKEPTADWAKAAEARLTADELVARVRAAALSRLGAGR